MINTNILSICYYEEDGKHIRCLFYHHLECDLKYKIETHEISNDDITAYASSDECQFHKVVCKDKEIYPKRIILKKEDNK